MTDSFDYYPDPVQPCIIYTVRFFEPELIIRQIRPKGIITAVGPSQSSEHWKGAAVELDWWTGTKYERRQIVVSREAGEQLALLVHYG